MGFSVLIADPNPRLVAAAKEAVERAGIAVYGATDGPTVMKAIAERRPSLVVAALDLEGSPAGLDLFGGLRKTAAGQKFPIVAIGDPLPEEDRRQLEGMFNLTALISRPVDVGLLARRIVAFARKTAARGAKAVPAGEKPQVFAGRLAEQPLHAVLLFLHRRRLSGRLILEGPEKIAVDIAGGKPYRVDSYHLGFGESLRRRELLSGEEFDFFCGKALAEGEASLEWLVRMGAISMDALRREKDRYQTAKLVEVFSWKGGEYRFRGGESDRNIAPLAAMNLPELIHRGLLDSAGEASPGEFFLRHRDQYVAVTGSFHEHLFFLDLEPYELDLAEQFEGTKTFGEIVAAGKGAWKPEQAMASIFAFNVLGMLSFDPKGPASSSEPSFPMRKRPPVEDIDHVKVSLKELESLVEERNFPSEESEDLWATESEEFFSLADGDLGEAVRGLDPGRGATGTTEPAWTRPREVDPAQAQLEEELMAFHESMKGKNHYEFFDLTPETFDFAKMKARYHELVRKFSPEQFMMSPGEAMAASEEVLSQVANAYNVLSNVVSKEQYDEQVRKAPKVPAGGRGSMELHIGVQYNSGLAFLEEGDYRAAEAAFREVLDVRSDHFEAIAHFAWAMYAQKGRRGNKTFADQAMRHLRTAQNERPEMPEICAYRGMILLDQGRQVLAEVEFKKALGRRPRMRLALEGLAEIDRLKAGERKKGFFSRR